MTLPTFPSLEAALTWFALRDEHLRLTPTSNGATLVTVTSSDGAVRFQLEANAERDAHEVTRILAFSSMNVAYHHETTTKEFIALYDALSEAMQLEWGAVNPKPTRHIDETADECFKRTERWRQDRDAERKRRIDALLQGLHVTDAEGRRVKDQLERAFHFDDITGPYWRDLHGAGVRRIGRRAFFTLTDAHIVLLRHMRVAWNDTEFGSAPAIYARRPYGNSSVLEDVAELVGMPPWDLRSTAEDAQCLWLHLQTQAALEVVLSTGAFEPGEYELDAHTFRWFKLEPRNVPPRVDAPRG